MKIHRADMDLSLARLAVRTGVVDYNALLRCVQTAYTCDEPLGELLVKQGLLTVAQLLDLLEMMELLGRAPQRL